MLSGTINANQVYRLNAFLWRTSRISTKAVGVCYTHTGAPEDMAHNAPLPGHPLHLKYAKDDTSIVTAERFMADLMALDADPRAPIANLYIAVWAHQIPQGGIVLPEAFYDRFGPRTSSLMLIIENRTAKDKGGILLSDSIAKFSGLRKLIAQLNLFFTMPLAPNFVSIVAAMPNLETLRLDIPGFRKIHLTTPFRRLHTLEIFRTEDLEFSDEVLDGLAGTLKILRIVATFRQLLSPRWFEKLTGLTWLEIGYCRDLRAIPSTLRMCTQLRGLAITMNASLTELPDVFDRLSQLKSCRLAKNRLATLPRSMQHLPKDATIDVADNQLSGIPAELLPRVWESLVKVDGNPFTRIEPAQGYRVDTLEIVPPTLLDLAILRGVREHMTVEQFEAHELPPELVEVAIAPRGDAVPILTPVLAHQNYRTAPMHVLPRHMPLWHLHGQVLHRHTPQSVDDRRSSPIGAQ